MILSENYIKVSGKQYKVKVQCVSTRRLTTMEWLIVNCAAKFHDSPQTGKMTLKTVFEEIFQLTSSEILIKPCIESLISEQAIILDVGSNFDYNTLSFSQIRLTEKGKRMAKDGLFPGATRELPLDIYYNPLTEEMNQYIGGNEQVDDAIDFGTPSDYDVNFPEDKIIEALHKGLVGRGKFVASKLRIESIDCLTATDWDNFIKIEVETLDGDQIITKPEIKEDAVKSLVTNLLQPKELAGEKIANLLWIDVADPQKILGSGKKIKEAFLAVARNGSIVGVHSEIYSVYKRNTSAFKGKVLVLWGEKKFSVQHDKEFLIITIPFAFDVEGCEIINEKNESLSICKKKYVYDGRDVFAPIAFEDKKIIVGGNTFSDWLLKIVEENYINDVRYQALLTLPLFKRNLIKQSKYLEEMWQTADIYKIIDDLTIMAETCNELGSEMICLDSEGDLLWNRLCDFSIEEIFELLGKIMSLNCIHVGSNAQKHIVKMIISKTEPPKTYNELMRVFAAIGIRTKEDARKYEVLEQRLYTHELIADALAVIMDRRFSRLPEFFALDVLFNEYEQAIEGLEFLITNLKIFEKNDTDAIKNAIINCPDIALIQAYISTINLKHGEFLSYDINIHTELKKIDEKRAKNFYSNIDAIKQTVEDVLRCDSLEKISQGNNAKPNEKNAQKVYVVDTCALIHNPDLLLYFSDEDYVRIPTKVIDELGKIKDSRSTKYGPVVARIAAKLTSDIEKKYLKLFNYPNKLRLMIENADLELLPADLDKNVPDNQILSVALKYKGWHIVIISDDGVFRLTSLAQKISTLTSAEFVKQNEVYKKSLNRWVDKFTKAGGDLGVRTDVRPIENAHDKKGELSIGTFAGDESIDSLPVKVLKKYIPKEINEQVLSFIQNNGIKTIGQFRVLSPRNIEGFKAKGRQVILKNNVERAVSLFNSKYQSNNKGTSDEKTTASIQKLSLDNLEGDGKEVVDEKATNEVESQNVLENAVDEALNSEQVAFVSSIYAGNLDEAMMYYLSVTNGSTKHEQAVFLRNILSSVASEGYTSLMCFIVELFPDWQIRQVIGYVDQDVVESVLPNTDWKQIIQLLISEEEYGKVGVLLNEWNIDIDYEKWFPNISKEDLLLQINSTYSIDKYINECLEGDDEKIIEFLLNDKSISSKVLVNVCVRSIIKGGEKVELYAKLLCNHFDNNQEEGKKRSLSWKNVIDIAIALPEAGDEILHQIVERCTSGCYQLIANKHYAQAVLTPRTMEPLTRMLDSNLSVSRVVYIYMNTKLRGEINIDRLIAELVAQGHNEREILACLKDYWILGKIKYVQEDGLVRVAAESISNSRLMVFWADKMHINGENGFVNPEVGQLVYFKLQGYKAGGQFSIHYICTDIAYIK